MLTCITEKLDSMQGHRADIKTKKYQSDTQSMLPHPRSLIRQYLKIANVACPSLSLWCINRKQQKSMPLAPKSIPPDDCFNMNLIWILCCLEENNFLSVPTYLHCSVSTVWLKRPQSWRAWKDLKVFCETDFIDLLKIWLQVNPNEVIT